MEIGPFNKPFELPQYIATTYKMIASLVFAVLVAGAVADSRFKDCGGSSIKVDFSSVKLPNPIVLRTGLSDVVGARGAIVKNFPDRIKIKLRVEKKILWGYVTVPCVSNLGSCTYDVSCSHPLIAKYNLPCPPKSGQFDLTRKVTIPNLKIPSFLANGQYKAKLELFNYFNNEKMACVEFATKIST